MWVLTLMKKITVYGLIISLIFMGYLGYLLSIWADRKHPIKSCDMVKSFEKLFIDGSIQ